MQKLCETYDNCQSEVGVFYGEETPLLPIYHSTQQAHIEAMIDTDGNFCFGRTRVLKDKKEAVTLIPCTESSAWVANGRDPHLLFDKLKYLAGDYELFTGKKSEYEKYIKNLADWCASPYGHPKVKSLLLYLQKGTLIADLIKDGVLIKDSVNMLLDEWKNKEVEKPDIFKAVKNQRDAFIRFRIISADGTDDLNAEPWKDKSIWESHIQYQDSIEQKCDYCYATGDYVPVAKFSPKKIRNAGDGAKLISGNDSSNFTYRGRFKKPEEAYVIGKKTTEKAHNALRWLIAKQGTRNDSQAIVTWEIYNIKIPDVNEDTCSFVSSFIPDAMETVSTKEDFAHNFNLALNGYKADLKGYHEVIIMGVDSATPGRMSVFYYREMLADDFINRIENWHTTCTWLLDYYKQAENKKKKTRVDFIGAPSPRDIAKAAYGMNIKASFIKNITERILPCIVDGARIPVDIMRSAARRASNPVAMEAWEYRKTLNIACALIRKYYNDKHKNNKEEWKVELDNQNNDRSYLFGRILAYMRKIEEYALNQTGEDRYTNAEKLQNAYCQYPAKYCNILYKQLRPYLNRLGKKANKLEEEMMSLISRLENNGFDNKPLKETFLLGYSAQINKFREIKMERIKQKALKNQENNNLEGEENE